MSPKDDEKEERADVEQQLQDYSDLLADEKIRRLVEKIESEIECRAPTPSQFKPWLRRFLEAGIHGDKPEFDYEDDVFLRDLRKGGFVLAVLWNIDADDNDSKDRRRGWWNYLPDLSIAWPVIHYVLEHDERDALKRTACKWITKYAPDPETAVAVLTERLHSKCPYAALQLSRLAPDTPGVVEVLANVLDHEWVAYNARWYDDRVSGAGEAAIALRRMGIRARPALARLRDAVLSDRHDSGSASDRWLAFLAYVEVAADDSEIGSLLDELASRINVGGEFLEGLISFAQERPAFLPHLSRLRQAGNAPN